MVRLISRQRGGLAALKLTKFFGINDFPASKDSGKVLIIIIYCYLIIIIGWTMAAIFVVGRGYAPTSNTASHDNHEKIYLWFPFIPFEYGALLGEP